jgi:hypothetical protein
LEEITVNKERREGGRERREGGRERNVSVTYDTV